MTGSTEEPAVSSYAAEHFPKASSWVGWIAFAGVMLMLLGTSHLLLGLVALFNEDFFSTRSSDLLIDMSYGTWAWVQMIGGTIVLVAGLCVFGGQVWARAVGVLVAFASVVASLGFMAAHPAWGAIVIVLAVVVILALTVHGSDIRPG